MKYLLFCLIFLFSGCSNDDIYKGKSEQEKIQMYHDARLNKVMRWTCALIGEEVFKYKEARDNNTLQRNWDYFHEYPYHFKMATSVYKVVIEESLKGHPYKLPKEELDISYIQPFRIEQLTCKENLSEWQSLKSEWEISK